MVRRATRSQEKCSTARARPATPHRRGPRRVPQQRVDPLGEVGGEPLRVVRGAVGSPGRSAPAGRSRRRPPPRGCRRWPSRPRPSRRPSPPGSRCPSARTPTGRRTPAACVSSWMTSGLGSISEIQITPSRSRPARAPARHLGLDLRRVGRARAEHELRAGGEGPRRVQEVDQPLLPGDPPDEDDVRPGGVDAMLLQDLVVVVRGVLGGVDAVVDDAHLARVDLRVGGQHVAAHPLRDRDRPRRRPARAVRSAHEEIA